MTDLVALAAELMQRMSYQKTPQPISQVEYIIFVIQGLKDLYIQTGRALSFSDSLFVFDDDHVPIAFNTDLAIDEQEYVLCCAEIAFLQKVQCDVNNIVGYSTDALSVSHADKPYQYLSDSIMTRQHRRKELFFKMPRYNQL